MFNWRNEMAENNSLNHSERVSVDNDDIREKINKVIEQTQTDIHHIIGKKYRNEYNVHVKQNKIRIPRKKHVAYNGLVLDKQNPRDAFKILFEMTRQVLSEWVRQELLAIFYQTPDDLFYIPEVLKWYKKKIKKKSETSSKIWQGSS